MWEVVPINQLVVSDLQVINWQKPFSGPRKLYSYRLLHVGSHHRIALCHVDGETGEVDIAGVVELEPALRRDVAILKYNALNGCAGQAMNNSDRLHIARHIDDL